MSSNSEHTKCSLLDGGSKIVYVKIQFKKPHLTDFKNMYCIENAFYTN